MMAGLAFGMAASAALLALGSASWPTLPAGLVACALSATTLSWHGILLAETARASHEDMRGGVTGSYGIGFVVCGLPALLVGVQLLRQRASARR